ncbi:MAG: dipeptidase [Bacteroidales bacterium]|nr:dipeptidase [Bacteroidales bacterium]MCB8999910.1 dipeptidase [Bacteroidales bacterium]
MSVYKNYIVENKQRFLEELFGLIRIPSVSAKPEHKGDMLKAAEYIRSSLISAGADKAEIMSTKGFPVVYAEKIIDPSKPTILVYGHYDVQPAEPLELWKSKPFEPEVRDGKIFARGADDDKGQMFMHVKAFELMNKTGTLSCNVKFMIEGEEEVGSPSLKDFCKEHKNLLKADIILISDTTMIARDIPSITVGLRGLSYFQVELTGPNRDLHSGLYGGAVANPANMLAKMIASLSDENNHITIPGFYDDVLEVSDTERKEMAKAPFNLEEYKKALDIDEVVGEKGYTTIERTGIRPTLDVCGIWSGYTGEGAKTVLPSKAFAKISMRLVPNQNSKKIDQLFEKHFKAIAPAGIKVKVSSLHGGEGYVSPIDTPGYLAASEAIETVFGKKPVPTRSGGSIPIVADFEEVLGIKSILMGFGLDSDAIHSPNESYPLDHFYLGIETIPHFYKNFAEKSR